MSNYQITLKDRSVERIELASTNSVSAMSALSSGTACLVPNRLFCSFVGENVFPHWPQRNRCKPSGRFPALAASVRQL